MGETVPTPSVIFSDADNVIPDVVWISKERLATSLDEAGHLTVDPELIVEVLSSGADNERRAQALYQSRCAGLLDSRLATQTSRGPSPPNRGIATCVYPLSRRSLNLAAVTRLYLRR